MGTDKLDCVDYFRSAIAGSLLALVEQRAWSVKQAAHSLGASEQNVESLIASKIAGMPLEVLVDMAASAGLKMQLSITLPK